MIVTKVGSWTICKIHHDLIHDFNYKGPMNKELTKNIIDVIFVLNRF